MLHPEGPSSCFLSYWIFKPLSRRIWAFHLWKWSVARPWDFQHTFMSTVLLQELTWLAYLAITGICAICQTNPWCASWLTNKTRYKTYMPKSIDTSTHIFVRTDMVKKSFHPPDNGPYKVVARSGKHYTLPVGGKPTSTSVDRLKSAFVDPGQQAVSQPLSHQPVSIPRWFTYDYKQHFLLPSTHCWHQWWGTLLPPGWHTMDVVCIFVQTSWRTIPLCGGGWIM